MALPDSDSFDTYGGEKIDYSDVEDPSTDLSAEESNEARASTSMMTRTAVRAWCSFNSDGTIDAGYYDAVYGNDLSVKPTVVQNVTGDWRITFPATVTDPRGNTHTLNLRSAQANYEGQTGIGYVATATVLTERTVEVYIYDLTSAGALTDPAVGDRVTVWVN